MCIRDRCLVLGGNYAYTKVGDEVVMTSKSQLINAYKRGGEDAVIALIGEDAAKQLGSDEDINSFSDGSQLVNQVTITDKGREFIANSAKNLNLLRTQSLLKMIRSMKPLKKSLQKQFKKQ